MGSPPQKASVSSPETRSPYPGPSAAGSFAGRDLAAGGAVVETCCVRLANWWLFRPSESPVFS